jgi:hypothetical protein
MNIFPNLRPPGHRLRKAWRKLLRTIVQQNAVTMRFWKNAILGMLRERQARSVAPCPALT